MVRRGMGALAVALAAGIASTASAEAATRYVTTTGTNSDPTCPISNPCDLDTGVEHATVVDGDEVIITPGTYTVTQLVIADAIDLHGQSLQPDPVINTSAFPGISVNDAATVRDLQTVNSSAVAISPLVDGVTIERVIATSAGTGCATNTSITIRDSVCKGGGIGVGTQLSSGPTTKTIRLRNVTAIGTSSAGLSFDYSGPGVDYTIDAVNVIADGGTVDVRSIQSSGAFTRVNLANSNYATTQVAGGATVTAAGTGTNQITPPVFVNAGAGDYHQTAASPTVDAGTTDAFTGTSDFDNEARSLEGDGECPTVPDIGADELTGAGPIDCDPPETSIAGPSDTTSDPTPTFTLTSDEAGSTFECRLGGGAFSSCESSFTTPALSDGAHTLEARATDSGGNVDSTPATQSFSVDATAPETTITKAPKKKIKTKRKRVRVTFAFSSESGARFECALDDNEFTSCDSPAFTLVGKGKHTLAVRAIDQAGNTDGSPAKATFTVKRKKPKR